MKVLHCYNSYKLVDGEIPLNGTIDPNPTNVIINNHQQTIELTPNQPYSGMSKVNIDVNVPTNSQMIPKTLIITQNGTTTANPVDDGVDGYNNITINTNVPQPLLSERDFQITSNGTFEITPIGSDALTKVNAHVNVPTTSQIGTKNVTIDQNGQTIVNAQDEALDGYSSVTINTNVPVPQPQDVTISMKDLVNEGPEFPVPLTAKLLLNHNLEYGIERYSYVEDGQVINVKTKQEVKIMPPKYPWLRGIAQDGLFKSIERNNPSNISRTITGTQAVFCYIPLIGSFCFVRTSGDAIAFNKNNTDNILDPDGSNKVIPFINRNHLITSNIDFPDSNIIPGFVYELEVADGDVRRFRHPPIYNWVPMNEIVKDTETNCDTRFLFGICQIPLVNTCNGNDGFIGRFNESTLYHPETAIDDDDDDDWEGKNPILSTPQLQQKTVDIDQNGQEVVEADNAGGMSKVTINVNVPEKTLGEVTKTYDTNGQFEIEPETTDGISKAIVNVNVPKNVNTTNKLITVNDRQQQIFNAADDNVDGYDEIVVDVTIPETTIGEVTKPIDSNGTHEILPDGTDAMSKVTVEVNVPGPILQEKTETYDHNDTYEIEPDPDNDGMSKVIVTVDVPGPTLQEKTETYDHNDTYEITPDPDNDGMSKVTVTVDVPAPVLTEIEQDADQNGDLEILPEPDTDGMSKVTVHINVPPNLEERTVDLDAIDPDSLTAEFLPENADGMSKITVKPILQEKQIDITANEDQIYTPDTGIGFSSVHIITNVQPNLTEVEEDITTNGDHEINPEPDTDGMSKVTVHVNIPITDIKAPEDVIDIIGQGQLEYLWEAADDTEYKLAQKIQITKPKIEKTEINTIDNKLLTIIDETDVRIDLKPPMYPQLASLKDGTQFTTQTFSDDVTITGDEIVALFMPAYGTFVYFKRNENSTDPLTFSLATGHDKFLFEGTQFSLLPRTITGTGEEYTIKKNDAGDTYDVTTNFSAWQKLSEDTLLKTVLGLDRDDISVHRSESLIIVSVAVDVNSFYPDGYAPCVLSNEIVSSEPARTAEDIVETIPNGTLSYTWTAADQSEYKTVKSITVSTDKKEYELQYGIQSTTWEAESKDDISINILPPLKPIINHYFEDGDSAPMDFQIFEQRTLQIQPNTIYAVFYPKWGTFFYYKLADGATQETITFGDEINFNDGTMLYPREIQNNKKDKIEIVDPKDKTLFIEIAFTEWSPLQGNVAPAEVVGNGNANILIHLSPPYSVVAIQTNMGIKTVENSVEFRLDKSGELKETTIVEKVTEYISNMTPNFYGGDYIDPISGVKITLPDYPCWVRCWDGNSYDNKQTAPFTMLEMNDSADKLVFLLEGEYLFLFFFAGTGKFVVMHSRHDGIAAPNQYVNIPKDLICFRGTNKYVKPVKITASFDGNRNYIPQIDIYLQYKDGGNNVQYYFRPTQNEGQIYSMSAGYLSRFNPTNVNGYDIFLKTDIDQWCPSILVDGVRYHIPHFPSSVYDPNWNLIA